MNTNNLSLDEFKKQVACDYKFAFAASLNKSFSNDCNIAQVALAKAVTNVEACTFSSVNMAFEFAIGRLSPVSYQSDIHYAALSPEKAISSALQVSGKKEVAVCVLSTSETKRGCFWQSLIEAMDSGLPLALVVMGFGSELPKLVSGFAKTRKVSVLSVRADDYPSLCNIFEQQLSFCQSQHLPSLTIVEGQDDFAAFANWITNCGIATTDQLSAIESACRNA